MKQNAQFAPSGARTLRNWLGILLAALLLAGCAAQRLQKEGRAMVNEGRIEEGIARFEAALREDPSDGSIRAELLRTKEQAVTRLVNSAFAERAAERFEAAKKAFLRRARGHQSE